MIPLLDQLITSLLYFLTKPPFAICMSILQADLMKKIMLFPKFHDQKSGTFLVQRGMLRMAVTSMDRNTSWSRCTFQVVVVTSINSETEWGGLVDMHPYGLIISSLGIQFSSHIFVSCPLPILLITPYFSTSRLSTSTLQIWLEREYIYTWSKHPDQTGRPIQAAQSSSDRKKRKAYINLYICSYESISNLRKGGGVLAPGSICSCVKSNRKNS